MAQSSILEEAGNAEGLFGQVRCRLAMGLLSFMRLQPVLHSAISSFGSATQPQCHLSLKLNALGACLTSSSIGNFRSKHAVLLVAVLSLTASQLLCARLSECFAQRGNELGLQCVGHSMKALCLSSLRHTVCTTFSSAMTYWLPEPRSVSFIPAPQDSVLLAINHWAEGH